MLQMFSVKSETSIPKGDFIKYSYVKERITCLHFNKDLVLFSTLHYNTAISYRIQVQNQSRLRYDSSDNIDAVVTQFLNYSVKSVVYLDSSYS